MGKEVPESEKESLECFFKTYYLGAQPIRRETYKNGEFVVNDYYVTTIEEIEDRLRVEPSASFIYNYKQNEYRILESRSYSNGSCTFAEVFVFDVDDNDICLAKYSEGGKLETKMVEKNYFKAKELIYTFAYLEDGSCFYIYSRHDDYERVGDPNNTGFNWEGFEYYRTAEPIIPEK